MCLIPTYANPIRIGVSACLLGEKTRYDGAGDKSGFITGRLGKLFILESDCPEVGIGLPTPRDPIHLVGRPSRPRAVGLDDSKLDVTRRLETYGRRKAKEGSGKISGYIFKSGSPSCGLKVKISGINGNYASTGAGLFARRIIKRMPNLPVVEESKLEKRDYAINFINRVLAYSRWERLNAEGFTKSKLLTFHNAYSMVLATHNISLARKLDKLVLNVKSVRSRSFKEIYLSLFMETMVCKATPARHIKVLKHAMRRIKKQLDIKEKTELGRLIEEYRRGQVSLTEPVKLLKRLLVRYGDEIADNQIYFNPDPMELALRLGA